MALPQWIGGRVIFTLAAATATGRLVNIPASLGSNESRKATSISAANTLPSTLRVIWKAQSKQASEQRMRSSQLCASSSLSSRHLLQVLGIPISLHFDL